MKELLNKLTSINGVSGNEENVAKFITEQMKEHVDEIKLDAMGNLICIKKGTGKKIMLAAHMDEVGIIVTHIEDNGFLRFTGLGGINQFASLYQKIIFNNDVIGVVGYEEDLEEFKDLKIGKMYIDIGVKSKEEAEKKVSLGDVAAFIGAFTNNEGVIISKALDDRIGCAILIELAKTLNSTNNEIYFVFTTQEELGLRGAKTAAYSVNPDISFVVDVTGTGDTPKAKPAPIKCGNGPIIKIMDRASIIHPKVKEILIGAAEASNIHYQLKVATIGGTDAGVISLSREGVPTGVISIPCRYLHSPAEVIDINDALEAVKLLGKVICEKIEL